MSHKIHLFFCRQMVVLTYQVPEINRFASGETPMIESAIGNKVE